MDHFACSLVNFVAHDVTGTMFLEKEGVQAALPASAVAASLASEMQLPDDVPWGLRNDGSSEFLLDETPIGEQIEPGSSLTVTPKTHLG